MSPARAAVPSACGLPVRAVGGLLAGLLASGLVVVAMFTASAEDIGATLADRIGTSVEEAIVEGTRIATEESLEGLGGYEEDLLDPGGDAPMRLTDRIDHALGAAERDGAHHLARRDQQVACVVVVDVPEVAQTFGPQGNRQVVLGVPRSADGELASTISAAVDGGVVITGQG